MKANFWGQMSDEYLQNNPEPPPLTDEILAKFEQRIGQRLPKSLTDLLRIKNGGLLQNTDFRFDGKEYEVTYIKAVSSNDSYDSIQSYATILGGADSAEAREELQGMMGPLSQLWYFAEPSGYPFGYVLNYNKLNSHAEPTIWCIGLEYGEPPSVKQIADSFSDFLAGQYEGDAGPIVEMKEAERYRVLAAGGYSGLHEVSGNKVEMEWKVCLDSRGILVFQREDWGWGESVKRQEMCRSQFQESHGVLDSLFGMYQRFLLWRTGKEMGADLGQLANTKRLRIEKFDAPLRPRCFTLTFFAHTLGDKLTDDAWIRTREATPYEGRWKNSESKVWNVSISSASKEALEKARIAVVGKSPQG